MQRSHHDPSVGDNRGGTTVSEDAVNKEAAGFDKRVVDRIRPVAPLGHAEGRAAVMGAEKDNNDKDHRKEEEAGEGRQGASGQPDEPLPTATGAKASLQLFYPAGVDLTEEEEALLRPLPHREGREPECTSDGQVGVGDRVESGRASGREDGGLPASLTDSHPTASVEDSMDEHDYLMLTETLREVANPLLRTRHDPSLATSAAALGGMPDLDDRMDQLLGHHTRDRRGRRSKGSGVGEEEEEEDGDDGSRAADWAERRARRRRPEPPSCRTGPAPVVPPPAMELRPLQVRRQRRDRPPPATGAATESTGTFRQQGDGHAAPAAEDEERRAEAGEGKGFPEALQDVDVVDRAGPTEMLMLEPSPCDLTGKSATAPPDSPTASLPHAQCGVGEEERRHRAQAGEACDTAAAAGVVVVDVVSCEASQMGHEDEQAVAPAHAAQTQTTATEPRRRLKLRLGGGGGRRGSGGGGGVGGVGDGQRRNEEEDEEEGEEETEREGTAAPPSPPPPTDTTGQRRGLRLTLAGGRSGGSGAVPAVASALTRTGEEAADAAADGPPRKLLRQGLADDTGPAPGSAKGTAEAADVDGRLGTSSISSSDRRRGGEAPPTPAAHTAVVGTVGSPNVPSALSGPLLNPRGHQQQQQQRLPPLAAAPATQTTHSGPTVPTTSTVSGSSAFFSPTATEPSRRADANAPAAPGSGRRPVGSPLSPRRTTGDAASAFAAFVGSAAAASGPSAAAQSATGLLSHRRFKTPTPTPTPTPTALYNLSDATPHRTHAATKVPLPLSPVKVDFGIVTRWVEDTYETTEKISEGTYGEVYKGRVKLSGEPVALKRLKTLRGLDGFPLTSLREVIALQHINRQRRRLLAKELEQRGGGVPESEEAQPPVGSRRGDTAAAPQDPLEEMVELRDVLLSKAATHDIYLVFSYANSSMAGLLTRRFPFALPDIAYIFRKIVLGVKKLHDMGIIHRDIKTDNVLISQDGAVQLADFGLCVFEGSGARALTPSMINLSYRPPEMLLGATQYDTKVDIWSVGCFLAQVFLHQPPFYKRKNSEEQARAARHNRSAETELEQLAVIAEVLGPVTDAPANAFPASTCAHLEDLKKLQEAVMMAATGGRQRYFSSPTAQDPLATASSASTVTGLGKVEALFKPSFSFGQFRGFRRWFASQMDIKRTQHILSGGSAPHPHTPPPPLLLPSPACLDVLEAIFQYDPRRRPTAAQLLDMPFFQLFDRDGGSASSAVGGAFFGSASGGGMRHAALPSHADGAEGLKARELAARARLSERLKRVKDSHVQPPPQAQPPPQQHPTRKP